MWGSTEVPESETTILCANLLETLNFLREKKWFEIFELRNQVAQNDVTLRVTNSEIFIEVLLLSY